MLSTYQDLVNLFVGVNQNEFLKKNFTQKINNCAVKVMENLNPGAFSNLSDQKKTCTFLTYPKIH